MQKILPLFLFVVLFLGSIDGAVRLSETQGWTYLSFDEGVVQNAVKCTAPDELRKSQCSPDPTQIHLAYTRSMIALLLTYVDVLNNKQDFHKDFVGLFLGLGTGTIPRFVHHYFPDAQLDVVELDPEVVASVKGYIGLPENVNVYTQDALLFVKNQVSKSSKLQQRYDFIIHDAFTKNEPAHTLNTASFYTGLLKLLEGGRTGLSENGLVIANVWCLDHNYTKAIAELYGQVFNYVRVLGPHVGEGTDGGSNCSVLAHTPKSDKVTVTCSDGRCKKPKSKKKSKSKSRICSDIDEVVKIARGTQEEAGIVLPISDIVLETYVNRLFSDDTRFC